MDGATNEGRSLADTPTWSVATVTTVMVAVCFIVERSIYRFGKWLRKTKRKALLASLDKIKEELMLLGLISLMLGQWARRISEICVKSSLFSSRFYPCSREDEDRIAVFISANHTVMERISMNSNHCGEGHEPFVSYESLEQLHRFLFLLGVTHVLYSCFIVVLAMIKIYSWRTWEIEATILVAENLQRRKNVAIRRQSTFVFHHASHPWSKNKVLIWMLCFFRQFRNSIKRSDYMALRLGFITNHRLPLSYNFHKYMVRSMEDEFHGIVGISWPLWIYAILCIFINIHGLNIYFWLSFVPAILIVLIGTKLEHVVAQLALEVVEINGPLTGTQLKPRDGLFWFGKPELLLWLIQFISFQNAFEMATFLWSMWDLKDESCSMKNHLSIAIRLACGIIAQFWCSYVTLPLDVIISQMGSKFKKALVSESVRESLHGWCKRVKEKSKHRYMYSNGLYSTARSTCSLTSTIDEGDDETITVGTLSRCPSTTSLQSISSHHVRDDETITVGTLSHCPSTTSQRSISVHHLRDEDNITISGTLSRSPSASLQRSLSLNHVSVNCVEVSADDFVQQGPFNRSSQGSGYLSDLSDNVSLGPESDIDGENVGDCDNFHGNEEHR